MTAAFLIAGLATLALTAFTAGLLIGRATTRPRAGLLPEETSRRFRDPDDWGFDDEPVTSIRTLIDSETRQ